MGIVCYERIFLWVMNFLGLHVLCSYELFVGFFTLPRDSGRIKECICGEASDFTVKSLLVRDWCSPGVFLETFSLWTTINQVTQEGRRHFCGMSSLHKF